MGMEQAKCPHAAAAPESRGKEEDDDDVKDGRRSERQFEEYKVEGQYHIKIFRNAVREHDKLFETGVCVRVRVHVRVCVLVCLVLVCFKSESIPPLCVLSRR